MAITLTVCITLLICVESVVGLALYAIHKAEKLAEDIDLNVDVGKHVSVTAKGRK